MSDDLINKSKAFDNDLLQFHIIAWCLSKDFNMDQGKLIHHFLTYDRTSNLSPASHEAVRQLIINAMRNVLAKKKKDR